MFNASFLFLLCILMTYTYAYPQVLRKNKYSRQITRHPYDPINSTVIGNPTFYVVKEEDTLLDIAREYELGFNEMAILYPGTDPWMPSPGRTLSIPAFWVLPPTKLEQLVINIPEMRLYIFNENSTEVQTYPVGIGSEGWKTPEGEFSITEKRQNPQWYVPVSLQNEYGVAIMPPGPENPLGKYFMRFANGSYGIHGTHMPWGVGRLISHGCIRCYPEHISLIYPQVKLGTSVKIVYEPVKLGTRKGKIYVEVHPDVYAKIPDLNQYAADKLKNFTLSDRVDPEKYRQAVESQDGVPRDVTVSLKEIRHVGFDREITPDLIQKNDPQTLHSNEKVASEGLMSLD
jgi:L,D-transpeptidase ErfK/SrfK